MAIRTVDKKIANDIADFVFSPYKFVMYAFPWGREGTVLANKKGPDKWQQEFLIKLGKEVRKRQFDGTSPVLPVRMATASGHGIGKSALCAWIILWIMSTRPFSKGTVTANTNEQLRSKTWAELAKWHNLSINKHWFRYHNTKGNMSFFQVGHKHSWACFAQTCREENSESFAGQHAPSATSFYIFDEGSNISEKIYEVAEGGLTDGEPMIFLFGNPTRNVGYFYDCFHKFSNRWITTRVDSRDSALTNKTQIQEWIDSFGEDSDFVRVRVRGVFPKASTTQFIPSSLAMEAMKRVIPQKDYMFAEKIIGVDVARFGDDRSVICKRQGYVVHPLQVYRDQRSYELASKIIYEINEFKPHAVFIDVGNMGAGVVDDCIKLGYEVIGVNAGSKSADPSCLNKRAEMWTLFRDWLRKGGSLPYDEELLEETTIIEYGFDKKTSTKLVMESKDSLRARFRSPDKADAVTFTFAMPVSSAILLNTNCSVEMCNNNYPLFHKPKSNNSTCKHDYPLFD